MPSPSITNATKPDQQQRTVATMVTAFTADPITRWVLPEPHQYLTYFAVIERSGSHERDELGEIGEVLVRLGKDPAGNWVGGEGGNHGGDGPLLLVGFRCVGD